MSWDVVILNLPPGTTALEDVPDSSEIRLGALPDVLDLLRRSFGESIDLADPTWGTMEGDTFSIEFNIGSQDPCDSIMLHVRGDDAAIEPIRKLCDATGWRALDTTTGELMDFGADPAQGLRQWREFRDRVIPGAPIKGVKLTLPAEAGKASGSPHRRSWWQFWK